MGIGPFVLRYEDIWNKLSLSCRAMESEERFKKKLKAFPFGHLCRLLINAIVLFSMNI